MLTALISDLHLGTTSGADVARLPEVRERLAQTLADADRVVLLGDLLELREVPAPQALERAAPALRMLGEATAGREVVIVPGNHDHALAVPGLERLRLADRALEIAQEIRGGTGDLAGRVAALMPDTSVRLSYPGFWVRDDVFATHGHYLDLLLTVPRLECLAASAIARISGHGGPYADPAGFEDGLAPLYAFAYSVAQSGSTHSVTKGGALSRRVWKAANGSGGRGSHILGSVAMPAAVGAVNALGLGPFRSDISGLELRRAGLRAMGEVVTALGIDAAHVIFGHTHRAGPLPRDSEGWRLPGGTQLTNTGSWLCEPMFLDEDGPAGAYWPGRVTMVGDSGPPELVRVLDGVELPMSELG